MTKGIDSSYLKSPSMPTSSGCGTDALLAAAIGVATVATGSFVAMAALGYIQLTSALIASVSGLTDAVLICALSCKKCILDKPEKAQCAESSISPEVPEEFLPEPIPNPIASEEWEQRMTHPGEDGHYNLLDPGKPLASRTVSGFLALPTVGNYHCYENMCTSPLLGVRLPPSQLAGFPAPMQQLFRQEKNVELYFLVYLDAGDKSTRRNLIPHHFVMPEYDTNLALQQEVSGLHVCSIGGLKCPTQMSIYEPRGIKIIGSGSDYLAEGKIKEFTPHLHPVGESSALAISPNSCVFGLQPDVEMSSFYTAMKFRGRSVAFFTILLHKPHTPIGRQLQAATEQPSLAAFLDDLTEKFPLKGQISALFAPYS